MVEIDRVSKTRGHGFKVKGERFKGVVCVCAIFPHIKSGVGLEHTARDGGGGRYNRGI